jgi:hypothetical protein
MRPALRAAAIAPGVVLLGAAAALASEAGGTMPLDEILWEMGIKILDVAIIAFFAFKYLSKPIAQAMANRSENVRRALDEATAGRRDAEFSCARSRRRPRASKPRSSSSSTRAARHRAGNRAHPGRSRGGRRAHPPARAETFRQEIAKARAELHRRPPIWPCASQKSTCARH